MNTEHFCTLFDSKFLPMGLCLHDSLLARAKPFHLWILCMDEEVEKQLQALALPHVNLLSLQKEETPELLSIKGGRSRAEYCWTLTPFLPSMVFRHDSSITRVTYVDADLFFFQDPAILLEEFTHSKKSALLTEHAYAPEYEQGETSGRFCVQFMAFNKDTAGLKILKWWQERCIEWCFARHEDGKFGDQKYLDQWPTLFGNDIHILQNTALAMAPWNAAHIFIKKGHDFLPVFYHFHGLRNISRHAVRLRRGYKIGNANKLYNTYVGALKAAKKKLRSRNFSWPTTEKAESLLDKLRMLRDFFRGEIAFF